MTQSHRITNRALWQAVRCAEDNSDHPDLLLSEHQSRWATKWVPDRALAHNCCADVRQLWIHVTMSFNPYMKLAGLACTLPPSALSTAATPTAALVIRLPNAS
jgi:hypothetical protein